MSYGLGTVTTFVIFFFTTSHFSPHTRLLLVAFILLQSACTLTDTLLIKNNHLRVYLWVNLIYTLLFFAIHLYFFYEQFSLDKLIIGITCLSAFKAAAIFLVKQKHSTQVAGAPPDRFVMNWIFVGSNEIAGIIARWLDKLFLLYLLAPAQFAIFFNGAFDIPLFGILISAMENIMLTNISADILNRQAAKNIFRESFKILSLIAFPLFFFLLSMHEEGFAIIFKNKYNASLPVFLVSIFIIPVRITHYGVILQCYGQSQKIVAGSLMDIVLSLLLMLILYPLLGTPGVALAIVISTYLQAAYYLWQSAKLMQVSIAALLPVNFLLKLFVSLAAGYGLLYFVKDFLIDMTALVAGTVITILVIGAGLVTYWKKNIAAGSTGVTS